MDSLWSIIAAAAVLIILICIIAGASKSKNKKNKTPAPVVKSSGGPSAVNTATSSKNIDYSPIVEMTRIITDNDTQAIEKMRLLARNYSAFVAEHQSWCDSAAKRAVSMDRHVLIMNFFALWLTGYNTGGGINKNPAGRFGCYISGGEAPKNVIKMFEEMDRSLNYGLEFGSVNIAGADNATKAITAISQHLISKRYTLVSLEAGGTGFYLFIVPTKDHDKIMQSSSKVDFKIYRQILT